MSIAYRPKDDSMFNPNRKYPRNLPCPCQSGKKFKKCCLLNQPMVVKKTDHNLKADRAFSKLKAAFKERKNAR